MKTDTILRTLFLMTTFLVVVSNASKDHRDIKCHVCKATINEMDLAISKVDPTKKVEVGNFRLDTSGSSTSRKIPLTKSEMYLTELMETICDKMDDYARARYKSNGKITVLKLVSETGGMNPEMSKVDFVQDEDLNKSLKHLCLEILEDFEEPVVKMYMSEQMPKDPEYELCSKTAQLCDDKPLDDDDYNFEEEKDEL
ncbi:protein seele [Culicoides brevitarsis]|uniref:protein seele n=1 Tax=Culicoides brevitarsis TaxID=469753 RepID=UPI00307C07B2